MQMQSLLKILIFMIMITSLSYKSIKIQKEKGNIFYTFTFSPCQHSLLFFSSFLR